MVGSLVVQIGELQVEEVVSVVVGISKAVESARSSVNVSSVVIATTPLEDREYSNIVEGLTFGSIELPTER
jgi:hypothetical protein